MEASKQSVVIDLHGSKAVGGVELYGLQRWAEHFRRALRDFERSQSLRQEPVKRTGRPGPISDISTAFRLVYFRKGSGIATLEPLQPPEPRESPGAEQLDIPPAEPPAVPLSEPPAIRNLRSMIEAIDENRLDPVVVEALEDSRKAVGEDGHYGIKFSHQPNGRTSIDSETIQRLRAATTDEPAAAEPTEKTVSGLLHLIEVEEPERLAIRDHAGVDWDCTFESELEGKVLGLVKSIVRAVGTGEQTKPKVGRLHIRDIQAVPRHEQSSLFTFERVPIEEIEAQRGVVGPQGLAATADPEWADDEQDRAYLAFVLGDDAEP